MKQVLLFALALTMGAATANAGQQISFNHSQNQKQVMTEAQLPVQVKNFLKRTRMLPSRLSLPMDLLPPRFHLSTKDSAR